MSHSALSQSNVILHAFDWPYALVTERAQEIKAAGYKTILVSPPMKSFRQSTSVQWWQLYQPQDYRVIDNKLGNTEDFKAMMVTLNALDLWVYIDVVFNHMANESGARLDLQYPSSEDLARYRSHHQYFEQQKLFGDLSEPLFDENDFVEAFGIKNWKDRWEVQNGRLTGGPKDPGLPTLRTSKRVIDQQQAYLRAMKGLGVRGYRIDAAKHLSLEHIQAVFTDDITDGMHVFGEIITDGGATKEEYELFLQPYLKATRLSAYDFPLFNTLFEVFQSDGSMASLIDPYCFGQALTNARSITFATTHDIPNNDVFQNLVLTEQNEWLAYVYILGRDGGVPLIYSDLDPSGITNQQGQPRWVNSWNDPKLSRLIEFYHRMHGESFEVIEANDDILAFTRGSKGLVVINKSQRDKTISIDPTIQLVSAFDARQNATQGEVRVARCSAEVFYIEVQDDI
ncbi:alpha-amylase family glycosyl hydrolase [Vibrio sp. ZSDZ65]|uniref:Alpha-amylase n=1 Tax=Vibrio qingdaonensis TaxID=2829491 RepID=A0A9X3CM29_9VIBR|nr:alpha-amylase family glycosyl hydrolase [Vibrio qingdaonensis]MCW8345751.1 alpha-amylase family glycosyl hydrolase [Vibrio qingdaonensis]